MSTSHSVVLLGFGLGGRVFHAPLIHAAEGLSLDAIVTSDPGRRQEALDRYPGVRLYSTAEEAWAGGHDIAVITTANVTHVPFAEAALDSGLHVVLDKPIAPTADAARGLAERAARVDRLLIPFQNRRWDSDFRTVRAIVDSGELGRVHRFESRIERMRVVPKGGWRDSTAEADMGGTLYDLGAHLVDQALALMGPVVAVTAEVRALRGISDDDDVLLLEHESGAVSLLVTSLLGAFPGPRFTVLGTRGGLRIMASDTQEDALKSGAVPGTGWGEEPAEAAAVLRTFDDANEVTERTVPLLAGAWPDFYPAVARAVDGRGPVPVPLADVVADLRVLDAARESRGARIRLDPPAGHPSAVATG
jgi:predicted dehydrogenase